MMALGWWTNPLSEAKAIKGIKAASVGWAKRSVPTVSENVLRKSSWKGFRVGTALARLSPPYACWYFSEKQAADYIRELFHDDPLREHIDIVYAPMPEHAR
jgi:hypothetical protein